jgi:hypothetical protein
MLHIQHSGSTFILTVFCVWLNTLDLEANAGENHRFFQEQKNLVSKHVVLTCCLAVNKEKI